MSKSWKIQNKDLGEGATYSLKNAYNLHQSAKTLFDNGHYAHSLSIATLALEEFGKHCIIKEHWMEGKDLNFDVWQNKILKHDKKLEAIPNHLEKFTPKNEPPNVKQELKRYRKYLLELAKRKLEHLYVDWDKISEKWQVVDDSDSIKKKAEFAIETSGWTIKKYVEDIEWDKELLFTTQKKIIALFQKKKVHAFCNICSTPFITSRELLNHRKQHLDHDGKVSWHFS